MAQSKHERLKTSFNEKVRNIIKSDASEHSERALWEFKKRLLFESL